MRRHWSVVASGGALALVGSAAVVVGAVAVATHTPASYGGVPTTIVAPVSHTDDLDDFACPSPEAIAEDGTGALLPDDVVAVRSCDASNYDAPDGFEVVPDVVTQGVDRLVGRINSAQKWSDGPCAGVGGFPFALAFASEDGSVRTVHGETGGCGPLEVGGRPRAGSPEDYLEVFDDLVRAQRGSVPEPPAPPEPAGCEEAPATRIAPASLDDVRVTVLCSNVGHRRGRLTADRTVLTSPQSDQFWDAVGALPVEADDRCRRPTNETYLIGTDAWGARVGAAVEEKCGLVVVGGVGPGRKTRTCVLTAAFRRLLHDLVPPG